MTIVVPNEIKTICFDDEHNWTKPKSDFAGVGCVWEAATQLALGVPASEVRIRGGKKPDSGVDVIVSGKRYQCKARLLDGRKRFILLDKKINREVDFYALGSVHEDRATCEVTAILSVGEMESLVSHVKIVWHAKYEKLAYVAGNDSKQWAEEQLKRGSLVKSSIDGQQVYSYGVN